MPRTALPKSVGPSRWEFPDIRVELGNPGGPTDESGFLGVGADLSVETLVYSYRHGVFPWPNGRGPLPWHSPNPRGVLPPEKLYIAKSLRQTLRRSGWTATVDRAFETVIDSCSKRHRKDGTWITASMRRSYNELHELGFAHSVEVWNGTELVGGLYGILVGGVFTGESMFHRATDASKVAVVELVHRLVEAGGALVDVQLVTDHLATLGAIPIARSLFGELLYELRDDDVRLLCDELPVGRLATAEISIDPANAPPKVQRHTS